LGRDERASAVASLKVVKGKLKRLLILIGGAVAEAISMKYPSDLEEQGEGKISRYQAIAFGEEQTGVSMADYWTVKAEATQGWCTIEGIPVKIDTSATLLLTEGLLKERKRAKGKVHKDKRNL
jgi:hypothetical protein